MDLQATLNGQQGGEQADGAGPEDQDDLRAPDRPGRDAFDLLQALATTLVGSSSTPVRSRTGSSLTARPGATR